MAARTFLFISLFLLMAAGAPAGAETGKGFICDQSYALCTSAPCIPDPSDPEKKAICSCEAVDGKSFGSKSCEDRKPSTSGDGVTKITSSYSLAQAPTKPVLVCPSGNPWTDCLDSPCVQDPMDPLHAICTCDIVRSQVFVTYGGDCNTKTCSTAYWSGATVEMIDAGTAALMKDLGIEKSPVDYCPGMDPK